MTGFTPGRGSNKGPLRKIERVMTFGPYAGSSNRVLLECGHEARTEATYKARCRHCASQDALAAKARGEGQ